MLSSMSFAGSLAMPASFLGSGTVYVCPAPCTACVQMEVMTTSVTHEASPDCSAQKHERLTGDHSLETGVAEETFLGGIMLGP